VALNDHKTLDVYFFERQLKGKFLGENFKSKTIDRLSQLNFFNIFILLQAQSGDDDMGGDNVAVSMEESKMDDFFQEV